MKKAIAISLFAAMGLSACDGGGNDGEDGIRSLGSFFTKAFRQDRNDEPLSLEGQTIPSFPTGEPFDV